jgi:alcohol dehydrogenase class IV
MNRTYARTFQALSRCRARAKPPRGPERLNGYQSLSALLREQGVRAALLVTDAETLDLRGELTQTLEEGGTRCVPFDRTLPYPTVDNAEQALQLYLAERCAALIALGGSAALDCAKAVAARVAQPKRSLPQMHRRRKVGGKPPIFVAIPTSAGGGGEVTHTAALRDGERSVCLRDPVLAPRYAVLTPSLTAGAEPFQTAVNGLDALCRAVEVYIGVKNPPKSRKDAAQAVGLIFANLPAAYAQELPARENLQEAAHLVGSAFAASSGGYTEAAAHALGGRYGVPAALSRAVLLPHMLEIYGDAVCCALSELSLLTGVGDAESPPRLNAMAFIAALRELGGGMGLPPDLPELREEDIPELAQDMLKEANPRYPVPELFTHDETEAALRRVLGGR